MPGEFREIALDKADDATQLVRMMFESKPAAKDDDSYQSMCHTMREDRLSSIASAPIRKVSERA